jgi:hypothetical protein
VLGGYGNIGSPELASVLKFDSAQGTWIAVAPMPEARRCHAACAIGSDIYVFGGRLRFEKLTSVLKYDTVTNTWSTLAPMPLPCADHRVSVLDGDQVYIVGGGYDGKSVLHFDTASGVWSTLGEKHGSATFVLGGCLYVAGGQSNSSTVVERYDVASDTWTTVADMLEDRAAFCAVTIGSGDTAEEQDLFDSLIDKAARERV